MPTSRFVVLTALLLVLAAGMSVSAGAVSTGDAASGATAGADTGVAVAGNGNHSGGNGSVNVTVGRQLSTIIGVSSDEVRADFENTAFELSVEAAGEEERAEAIADRAEELREEGEGIREAYEEATEEYEAGEIGPSEYAQRLATLNARATNLLDSYEQFQQRAANISALELRAAGVNRSALERTVENLSGISGAGPAAILEQFTGDSRGEIELKTEDGLSIEVENEDGERSREFERQRDGDDNVTISQAAALETARSALSPRSNATWALEKASVHDDSGYYKFEFALDGTVESGEAEVRVDGSSGEAFRVEEKIEPREEDEGAEDGREIERPRDDDPSITVNESVALETARAALSNQSNATWTLEEASTHDDSGYYKFEFALNATDRGGEAEVRVDGSSGEVFRLEEEIESSGEEEDGEDADDREGADDRELALVVVSGTPAANATVTVQALADGTPAENVTVYLNGRAVGTTDANGALAVTLPASGEAELTAGEGELEFEFERDEEDEVRRNLNADASLDDGTVTVSVTYDGSGVANAIVYANDRRVGTTSADGTVSFSIDANATDELELEIVKGEFETEFEYSIENGSLADGDGDESERESEDNDEQEDDDQTEEGDEDAETDDAEEENETEDAEEDDAEKEDVEDDDDEDEEESNDEDDEQEDDEE